MAISGQLQDLSFLEILEFVSSGRRSGILSIATGNQVARFVVSEGRLVYASSDLQPRLGYTLVEKGLVDEEDIEQVLQLQARTSEIRPLGRLLLEFNRIDREVLEREVKLHITRVVATLVGREEGTFTFEVREIPPDQIVLENGIEVEEALESVSELSSLIGARSDTELWP